jgi:rRNA processing protein Krr1/Pno1
MDSNQPGTSKNAKRRAAKKAKEAEAGGSAPAAAAPAQVKEAAPPAKADPKPKAKAVPAAELKQPEPKVESKPKAEAKGAAKAKPKSKGAAKAAAKPEPVKEPEPVDPFFRIDDGTGDDWEVSTGTSKKQQRRLMKKEEQSMMQATLAAGSGTAEIALQNRAVVGNTPSPVDSKPKADVAKAVEIVVSGASVAEKEKSEPAVEKTPTSSVTLTVPEERIGVVIGPKGAKIKLIQEKTGVTISTTGGIFTITGEPSKVTFAEGAIRDMIEKGYTSLAFDDFQENFVQVHPSSIPSIIGEKGAIIRKLKEELGVEVSVPPVPKNAKTSKKYKVMIAGSADKVERAKVAINNICMYYHDEHTHPGEVHEELAVEDWMYSYIIGRGGSEMKHIQANFHVKVYIPREFSPNQQVVIVGEQNNVTRAKAYVDKVLWKAEHEPRGRDKVDDGDVWGKDDDMEPWMEQYMYKR